MRKVFKIIIFITGSLLLLILAAILYLNSPWGQSFVRGRVESYLHNKLKTDVHIGHLGYGWPKYVVLNDVLFLDQERDTLFAVNTLKTDLNMLKLFRKKIDVQQIVLSGVHCHIYRNAPDTNFNFTYILNAFGGGAGGSSSKQKDTSAVISFTPGKIKLDDIHLRINDFTGGMQFVMNLDRLRLTIGNMDMENMLFHIKDLSVAGLQTTCSIGTSNLPTQANKSKAKLQLVADNVNLQRIALLYNDNVNKLLFALDLGELELKLNRFGLEDNVIDIKKLVTKNTDVVLTMGTLTKAPAFVDSIVKIDTTTGWNVNAQNVDLVNVSYKMDDNSKPIEKLGLDYFHMNWQHTALIMKDFKYTSDTIAGDIKHFTGKEQCGLDAKEMRTDFNYNPKGAVFNNLYFQTPNTILQDHLEIHYPSLAAIIKSNQLLTFKIHVVNSIVGLSDLLVFVPQLHDQEIFKKYSNGHLRTEASITGTLNNLDIAHFYAAGLNNTEISLYGKLTGLPETKKLGCNFHIAGFHSSRDDITALLPGILPANIRIPDRFGAAGLLSGNTNDYTSDLVVGSSDGGAYIKGRFLTSNGKGKEEYGLALKTMQLNIGHILKQDSLIGPVTAAINIKGSSLDLKTMNTLFDGVIDAAWFKGYRYHDLTFSGNMIAKKGEAVLTSADTNLRMHLNGYADFSGKFPAVLVDIQIDSIDLQAMKMTTTGFRASGRIHADFPELNPDYPRGSISWKQFVVVAEGRRYFMDSIYAISRPGAETGQNIFINMGVLDARITGKTPLTKIEAILQDHIDRHYSSAVNDSLRVVTANLSKRKIRDNTISGKRKAATVQIETNTATIPADYNLNLIAHIYDQPMFHGLYPSLTSFDPVNIDGRLTPRNTVVNISAPAINYGPYTVVNGIVQLSGSDSAFNYRITVDQLTRSNLALYYAVVHGRSDNSIFTTNVSLSDAGGKERYVLKASMTSAGDSQVIRLLPGLKLNYETWQVNEPNRIVLTRKGYYVRNFGISNNGQTILADNTLPMPNSPMRVDIGNFVLAELTNTVSKNDTPFANGILSGNVTIEQMTPSARKTGDLQIQKLSVYGDTLGDLHALVNNKTDGQLDSKIILQGNGNDISLAGIYYLKPAGGDDFNLNLDINALSVRTFEGFARKQIKNSSGYLRGNLKVRGAMESPDITGEVRTDNLATTVSSLNTSFRMPAEHIGFNGKEVVFNKVNVLDNAGNKAQVNGSMDITELTNPGYKLDIKADNWHAVHSTIKDNKELYGDLILSVAIKVTGTVTSPSLDGNIFVMKGTKLTVTNPTKDPGLQSTKGIVVFVNMRDSSRGVVLMPRRTDAGKIKHQISPGSNFNVNITVDKNAEFSMIIDEASGDFINVHGEAYINAGVTAGGVFAMTGSYLLHGGVYQMNYNFIRRRFIIQDGSSVNFSGDPLKNTTFDVTAIYQANTPAYDLVMRQAPDPAQANYFRQSLPFDIDLYLSGNIMNPAIKFNIDLPENKVYPLSADQIALIQAKLSQVRQDTGALNKQVFAVLILGRFVSDDPFNSGTAQGIGSSAMQSVSTFIGEQLNKAARNLVKGVDMSVDLATKDDYTTGQMRQRTDLNVAASKRVLNDRLKLTVGNDFEVEGPQTNNNQSSYLPGNLSADYLISEDGRYTMQVYRRNYDEGVLQGFVTETGLNFIVNVDYNRFRYVFKRSPKRKSMSAAASDTPKETSGTIR